MARTRFHTPYDLNHEKGRLTIFMYPRRILSGLLSLALAGSSCTAWLPAAAAAPETGQALSAGQAAGSVALTLRFDLPQRADEVEDRDIRLTLTGGGRSVAVSLGGAGASGAEGLTVSTQALNVLGAPLTTEQRLGAYEAVIAGLPLGEYTMEVTGLGYTPRSAQVTLQDYHQHVLMATGNGTFTLGDVNGDGTVDRADLTDLSGHLGSTDSLDRYDLNGDGAVDVIDLSYVNNMLGVEGDPKVLSTTAIVAPAVESADLIVEGDVSDLFAGTEAVTLKPAEGAQALSIPIDFGQTAVTMSEISISSPSADGAIQAGTALVELEDGSTITRTFDAAAPAGVHAVGRSAGQSVVTISLGAKVAVKKVTITVTKVEGQTGDKPEFAAVTQIEFLKDIVSEESRADNQVKGLAATAGDGEVALVWERVNNITGYTVAYGTARGDLSQSLAVNTNQAVISGLKNNQTYYFQVTAVSGDWQGTPSAILAAAPIPGSVPGAPSDLVVEPADGALRLSWARTKDATYYQVFYRLEGASAWIQWGGNLSATSAVITGLTNGTAYEVSVKAGNQKGTGPSSAAAQGTPKTEALEMPQLPTDERIPNTAVTSISMENSNNVDKNLCPNFNLATDLIDNDPNTYWVARDYISSSNITYTLDGSYDMNYVLVVPYLNGRHPNCIKTFNLSARDAEGQLLYSANGLPASGLIKGGYVALAFPALKGVHSLTIGLNEVEGGGARVSIAEIAFYRSNTLSDDIAALFDNGSFTQLKGTVDSEQITALEERLAALSSFYMDRTRLKDELNLAKALLAGKPNALALVKQDFQSRSGSAAADQAAGQTASALQPLGVSVQAGATVAIYAQVPGDQPVYVVPTQFYGESAVWQGKAVALNNGRNYLTVEQVGSLTDPRGGVLYLTYAGAHPEQIKVQIRNASGVTQIPVLELSGWYGMDQAQREQAIRAYVQALEAHVAGLSAAGLRTDIRNATEIATPSVLLSLPADQVLEGLKGVNNSGEDMVQTMYQNILAWEEELFVANQVQGIIPSDAALESYTYPMTTRQNIRYMRMFAGAFMYAAGSHIGVEYGSASALVQGRPTSDTGAGRANGLFGWGIAHEIGHNMDKLGRTEITNNLYSLALQAWDGSSMALDTRLTQDGRWEAIFNKTAQARPGSANNVFVQLGMYWQLHLAYDEADQPLAFYNKFFQLWKSGAYSGHSYDERFALVASQAANRDLTEFFTRWGMTLSDQVKDILDDYPAEPRAIWYLNDSSRTWRLQSGSAAGGAASVSAAVEGSEVTLTISHTDSGKILGYEIRRNGTAIGFTTQTTYVDDLGAANNLAYTYSVVPVDKLGNVGAEAKADEVRVAYDKTIDPELYTLERSGEAVTITMKSGVSLPVTGVKVTGTGLSGPYTVKVKADAKAEEWTTAKTGTLSDELVAYFTKPGAAESDTRIWTYDAAVLELTGIPEGAQVELLDYPGDRVDFYEGAAVGLLKDDYKYGDGADDVIQAGTLVILGTYRGDPVYNFVEIEAVYNTTGEAAETNGVTTITRPMSGYGLLLAEIPADGAVSDTSDGFFLFVPDLEAEAALNAQSGVTDDHPLEIRANLYRSDDPLDPLSRRLTSQTLWLSFPEGEDGHSSLPAIELNSQLTKLKG